MTEVVSTVADSGNEGWTKASDRYQATVGQISLTGAAHLVDAIHEYAPFSDGSYVLDNGAGTGSVTSVLKQRHPSAKVLATDIAAGMLEKVDSLALPNVSTQLEDGVVLSGLDDETFTHTLSAFMIQFTPDQYECVESMIRVTKPQGVVGIAIWGERIDPEQVILKAMKNLKPDCTLPESIFGSWRGEAAHALALRRAGLDDVHTAVLAVPVGHTSTANFIKWSFDSQNPVLEGFVKHWESQGGDVAEFKEEVARIAEEEYAGATAMSFGVVLGWGRRAGH